MIVSFSPELLCLSSDSVRRLHISGNETRVIPLFMIVRFIFELCIQYYVIIVLVSETESWTSVEQLFLLYLTVCLGSRLMKRSGI